jgi:hypothetical protein
MQRAANEKFFLKISRFLFTMLRKGFHFLFLIESFVTESLCEPIPHTSMGPYTTDSATHASDWTLDYERFRRPKESRNWRQRGDRICGAV